MERSGFADNLIGLKQLQLMKKGSYLLNLSRGAPIKYYSSDRITQIAGNGLVTLIDEKTGFLYERTRS